MKDIAASIRYYQDVLGFTPGMSLPGDDGKLIHGSVQRGNRYLMFGQLREGDAHDQGKLGQGVVLYATVDDDEDWTRVLRSCQGRRRPRRAGADRPVLVPHRDWGVADPNGYLSSRLQGDANGL